MQTLLGFAPFILFVVLSNLSTSLGLWVAFGVAFVAGIRTFLHKREIRLFDAANIVLFGGLSLYTGFLQPGLSATAVRLAIDGGLMATGLYTVLSKQPFTLPYAREQTPEPIWQLPLFLSANITISMACTAAFALMAAADAAALTGHMSVPLDMAFRILVLIGTLVFSVRYPGLLRKRFGLAR